MQEFDDRGIFDIAAAARSQLGELSTPCALPEQVARTRERMKKLNPEFVGRAIAQLMITPDYEASGRRQSGRSARCLDIVARTVGSIRVC